MEALDLFLNFKEQSVQGRYLTLEAILPILKKHNTNNQVKHVGNSVQERPIYTYQIGTGKTKIFLWSQMHGNESTTTKALLDFINLLNSETELAKMLLESFTFLAIPILNPDGAYLYTRENANKVDLNRDAQDLTQPESLVLRGVFEVFQPDYCFNLHDQRTIFGVADSGKPATVSFLAPSYNEERDINATRLDAIRVINNINSVLQNYIPGQVGRFDDSFNINCIGDTFQSLGVPTILFEAGHFPDDYLREETRKYIFISLLVSFTTLSENDIVDNEISQYLNIPQNNKCFYDFIYKNVKIIDNSEEKIINFAAQYTEVVQNGQLKFVATIAKIDDLQNFKGHLEYDCEEGLFESKGEYFPKIEDKADFFINNLTEFNNGVKII